MSITKFNSLYSIELTLLFLLLHYSTCALSHAIIIWLLCLLMDWSYDVLHRECSLDILGFGVTLSPRILDFDPRLGMSCPVLLIETCEIIIIKVCEFVL